MPSATLECESVILTHKIMRNVLPIQASSAIHEATRLISSDTRIGSDEPTELESPHLRPDRCHPTRACSRRRYASSEIVAPLKALLNSIVFPIYRGGGG
jgi:hypothetical protein